MGIAATISGLFISVTMILIFISAVRRSQFGWLIIYCEYFYFLGLGAAPLVMSALDINASGIFQSYESRNGQLGLSSFVHITLYGVGALFGYFSTRRSADNYASRIIGVAQRCNINNYNMFYWVCGLSLLANTLYFYFVGVENALLNASLTRSGVFSGLVGFEQYQFFKRLALIGSFSVIFIPFILSDGRRDISTFIILVVVTIPIYLLTVARSAILETLGVFFILFFSSRKRWGFIFPTIALITVCLLIFTFVYGKNFVAGLSSYLFLNKDFELIQFTAGGSDQLNSFFGQFVHLLYSIDAGINHFFAHGPTFAKDVLLSPLGILPSSWFSAMGLDYLSYQNVPVNEMSSAINTNYFEGGDKTFVPPYYTGFSAYLFPFVGGFIFGFVRFWMYAIIERSWVKTINCPENTWFPYLLLLLIISIMLFIPTTVSLAVFISLIVLFFLSLKRLLIVITSRRSAVAKG